MVFIDYQNFNIASQNFFRNNNKEPIRVDYVTLAKELTKQLPMSSELMKTYLFAYKPSDDLLESVPEYARYYKWLTGLKTHNYLEIIEGRQEIRPINSHTDVDLTDPSTYTTTEKGTDVNLAVTMLSKAYNNSFDISILVSGDTDYIPVVELLHQLGKIVVIATMPDQNISKYDAIKDAHIKMHPDFLCKCVRDKSHKKTNNPNQARSNKTTKNASQAKSNDKQSQENKNQSKQKTTSQPNSPKQSTP